MSEYNTRTFFSSGSDGVKVAAMQMELREGESVVTHKHKYDHLSILAEGKCVFTADGEVPRTYTAPACINVIAGKNHGITAIEDSVWYCIHATEETDESKLDKVLIMEVA